MRFRYFTILQTRALSGAVMAAGTLCFVLATRSYGAVTLKPGQSIQAAVNNYPAGTTFVLSAGVYRNQTVVPKQSDIFVGQSGAYLNGATVLTSFSRSGSYYLSHIHISQISAGGSCLSNRPGCAHPEDLFYDGRRLERVNYASSVTPGRWYYNTSTSNVYMADYPWGHSVQISTSRHAFLGSASGVVIRSLHIQKYANPAQDGAIDCGPTWTVEQNEISYNHGVGIHLDSGDQALNNSIHHNGQIGLSGEGNSIVVQGNEIAYNNAAGYNWSWEAGGAKFTSTNGLSVRSNYSHDNLGPGFQTDYNNSNTVYDGNRTSRNLVAGIQHEISFSAVIRYNTIVNDGYDPRGSSAWWGGGIRILASSNVQVYGNTLTNCRNSIVALQTDRGSTSYEVRNLWVHNNTVYQTTGTAAGIVAQSKFEPMIYTSWNNHFNYNTYHLISLGTAFFAWQHQVMSFGSWRNYGNDRNGTALLL